MSEFNAGKYLFSFLAVSVLPLVDSQIHCRIAVDSTQGLWLDTTTISNPTNDSTFCESFSYQETNLTCTSHKCQPINNREACTIYQNAKTWQPILTTCTANCSKNGLNTTHEVQNFSRYNKTKMCIPKFCTDTCTNGWCDYKGDCICSPGYSRDPTDKCVDEECLKACAGGTCDSFGTCLCANGSVKDPRGNLTCGSGVNLNVKRAKRQTEECVVECEKENKECKENECVCKNGSKITSNAGLCEKIKCPSEGEDVDYCKSQCVMTCKDGTCDSSGTCKRKNCNTSGDCECRIIFWDVTCYAKYVVLIIFGGLLGAVVIVCVVLGALILRKRMRSEQYKKDNGRFNMSDFVSIIRRNRIQVLNPRPLSSEPYLEPRQPEQQRGETHVYEDIAIYDTPYDHFRARGLQVRPTPPTALYMNQEQALEAQGQIGGALYAKHPLNVGLIQQQRKKLKVVERISLALHTSSARQ